MLPVVSHRRSGTHLAMAYLQQNYNKTCQKHHQEPEDTQSAIYIVRDGRDVLASCYFWWKSSGESKQSNIAHNFAGKSLTDFLHGNIVPQGYRFKDGLSPQEVASGIIDNPIRYWVRHIQKYIFKHNLRFIRYEHMINDLQAIFGEKSIKPITQPVGHHPRKGQIGDYKNHFTQEDINFFDFIAKDTMKLIGYE